MASVSAGSASPAGHGHATAGALGLPSGNMGEVEETIFAVLSRNPRPATSHFKLPADQVIEIGTQIDL